MSNEEFDILKEELTWQGSKVAVLRYACGIQRMGTSHPFIQLGRAALPGGLACLLCRQANLERRTI